jgi:hypothetical protein
MNVKKPYHGTCLVHGKHEPGTEAWRECPLRNAQARSDRSKKAAQTRSKGLQGPVAGQEGV